MKLRLLLATLAVAFVAAQPGNNGGTNPTDVAGSTGGTDAFDSTGSNGGTDTADVAGSAVATDAVDTGTGATGASGTNPTAGTDAVSDMVVESDATPKGTIMDILLADEKFSSFVEAITQAGLLGALSAGGPLTVFAPTDDSFDDLDIDMLLKPVWVHHLRGIVDFHVIEGALKTADVDVGTTIVTMEGSNITVTDLDPVTIDFDSNITIADIPATNGVIQVVNNVLLPPFTSYSASELIATMPLSFSTFIDLLHLANLTAVLDGPGPYTVFAPSNDAFIKLDDQDLQYMTSEAGFDDLVDVLKYHIISGIAMSSDIMVGDSAIALNGENMTVTMVDPEMVLNGVSTVISPDNLVINGVVHFIDTVLLPAEDQVDLAMPENSLGGIDVAEFVGTSSNFTTLYDLLNYTNLLDNLQDDQSDDTITLMAPVDFAFDQVEGFDKYLEEEWFAHLYDILSYHIVDGALNSSAFYVGLDIEAAQGDYINVTDVDPEITLNDDAHIIEGDVLLVNGIIHPIDHVLLPDSALYNIYEMGEFDSDFTLFIEFVQKAGLVDLFSGEGPYTVFAPSNSAFQRLSSDAVARLNSDEGAADLAAILKFHVIPGNVLSDDLSDGDMFATVEGGMIKISIDADGTVRVNDAMIEDPDVLANNGVIHSLDSVLIPETISMVSSDPTTTQTSDANVDAAQEGMNATGEIPEVVVAEAIPTSGAISSFALLQSSMLLCVVSYLLLA